VSFGGLLRAALPGFEVRSLSLENPAVPVSVSSVGPWLSGSGVEVSESTALGLTAYLRAVSLISSSLAMLPLRVYYRGSRRLVVSRTVLDSPSPDQTPFEFWQTWLMHQLSWGNAYGFKIRDGAGVVRQVRQIHPSRVKVSSGPAGKVFEVIGEDGQLRSFSSFEVAHLPFLSPDGMVGLSPLQACSTVLGSAMAAEVVSESFYRNGTKLSGVMNVDATLTETQANSLKSRWNQLFAGPSKAGDVAILDSGAKFTPLTLPPEDAQLLQSRAFGVTEIARMFGVPSHFLNDQEKATAWGSGIESMGIGYVVYTLLPRVKAAEQRITRELLPGGWDSGEWEARWDLKGLLRGDAATRAQFYRAMTDLMVMTNHDVAELEDMDPPPGAPVYAMPSNFTLVDSESGDAKVLAGAQPPPADPSPDPSAQAHVDGLNDVHVVDGGQ